MWVSSPRNTHHDIVGTLVGCTVVRANGCRIKSLEIVVVVVVKAVVLVTIAVLAAAWSSTATAMS